MQARFYSFAKRNNDTSIPSGTGTIKDVTWKENTSILNPEIELYEDPTAYTYVYLPKWNRYYFINDISFDKGLYRVSCNIDPLGSHRSTILGTPAVILYASGSNVDVVDNRIPIKNDIQINDTPVALGWTITDSTIGSIVVGITGKGSFGPYLLEQPLKLGEWLDGVDNWWNSLGITSIVDAAKQFMYGDSASECLRSAISLPLVLGGDPSTLEDLHLGNYPVKDANGNTLRGYKITNAILKDTKIVPIPWVHNDWRRNSPYTEVIMYFPFVGCVTIPSNDIIEDSSITVTYSLNITSGDISIQYTGTDSGRIVGTASGNIACNTAYGSTGINNTKLTTAVPTGAGVGLAAGRTAVSMLGASTGVGIAVGAAAGLLTAAAGTFDALGGTASGSGGLGGGASQGLDKVLHCFTITRDLTDSQANLDSLIGKPVHQKHTVGSYSGYVQTSGFSVGGAMTEAERNIINGLVDKGIYVV